MKSAQQVAEKWAQRSANASQDYVEGARTTDKDQAESAIASEKNYELGIQASIARKGYSKGLKKSGHEKWKKGVVEKGGARFSQGVASASDEYARNSAEFDTARQAADKLPRGPKGSQANLNRVQAVVEALRKKKLGA